MNDPNFSEFASASNCAFRKRLRTTVFTWNWTCVSKINKIEEITLADLQSYGPRSWSKRCFAKQKILTSRLNLSSNFMHNVLACANVHRVSKQGKLSSKRGMQTIKPGQSGCSLFYRTTKREKSFGGCDHKVDWSSSRGWTRLHWTQAARINTGEDDTHLHDVAQQEYRPSGLSFT